MRLNLTKSTDGISEITKWNQDIRTATTDAPTMCAFLLDMAVVGIAAQNAASLMEAVAGLTYTPDEILQAGERINNLARTFNTRKGLPGLMTRCLKCF